MSHAFKYVVTAASFALDGAPVLMRGTPEEQFAKASALGYDALEFHLRTPDDLSVDEVKHLMVKYGISVSAVATGLAKLMDHLCFIDDDPAVRSAAVSRIKGFVDWSEQVGCGIIIGSMRGCIPDKTNRDEADCRMREALTEILTYSNPKHVPIYLEVINRYENNYLNTAAETSAYVNTYDFDNLFVHLDTFHMNIEEADMCEAIRFAGNKLGYIHFADNNRHACGEGCLDFKSIQDALSEIGYHGAVSVECLPIPTGEAAAANSLSYLLNL